MLKNRRIHKYRILIIDDKKEQLNSFKNFVDRGKPINIYGVDCDIEFCYVHVDIIKIYDNLYELNPYTIQELEKYCNKHFDLILMDYGYSFSGLNINDLYSQLFPDNKQIENKYPEALEGYIFNPSHLAQKVVAKHFNRHEGKIIVYTHIWKREEKLCPKDAILRENKISHSFPSADIELINTRIDFFNENENLLDNNEKKIDYFFAISKFLEGKIYLEIGKQLEKTKIKQYKYWIKKNFSFLLIFCAMFGAITQFLGSFIVSIYKDMPITAIFCIVFTLLITLLGGSFVIYLIEKKIKK